MTEVRLSENHVSNSFEEAVVSKNHIRVIKNNLFRTEISGRAKRKHSLYINNRHTDHPLRLPVSVYIFLPSHIQSLSSPTLYSFSIFLIVHLFSNCSSSVLSRPSDGAPIGLGLSSILRWSQLDCLPSPCRTFRVSPPTSPLPAAIAALRTSHRPSLPLHRLPRHIKPARNTPIGQPAPWPDLPNRSCPHLARPARRPLSLPIAVPNCLLILVTRDPSLCITPRIAFSPLVVSSL